MQYPPIRDGDKSFSTIVLGLLLWLAFSPVVLFVDRQVAYEICNAVVFSVATGVVVGYAPGVWQSLRTPITRLRAGDALQIGVAVGWSSTAVIFGALFWWRLTGKTDDIIDSGVNLYSRWVLITSGFMHLAASGSIDGYVPLRSYLRAGAMTAIGVLMGSSLLAWAAPQVMRGL